MLAIFDVVLGLLRDALPREVDFSETPTIFTAGLDELFVRDNWGRAATTMILTLPMP